MNLCLIPARGGSKRIPRKNIRPFQGKPMISWSIDAARAANCFDRIVVSTEDEEIANISEAHGAEVVARPPDLADDHTTTAEVVNHFLNALVSAPKALCCLYATAPFVNPEDLRAGMAMMDDAQFAIPVINYPFPIQRAVQITQTGHLAMLDPAAYATRSQDLVEVWHDAGQFYCGHPDAWKSENLFDGAVPIRLPRWRVIDIDTEEDWLHAELIAQAMADRGFL